jgi:hypothetical protein
MPLVYSPRVRWGLALVVLLLRVALPADATTDPPDAQTVTPVTPPAEQRLEPLVPQGEQRVEALSQEGFQEITGGRKSPLRRGAETAGKVVLGVFAASVAIGAMLASLFLL